MGANPTEEEDAPTQEEEEATARQAGIFDCLSIISGALAQGEIPENDVKMLMDMCIDSLIVSGWFERDGAKLIQAGIVPIRTDTIPGMPSEMKA